MDVEDPDIDKMLSCGLSDAALYKMYGNSIVTSCLVGIFDKLFLNRSERKEVTLW